VHTASAERSHTFAKWLENAGIPARVIDELMGHPGGRHLEQGSRMGRVYRETSYASDVHGSVSQLLDDAGNVTASYGYSAYGRSDAPPSDTESLTSGDPDPQALLNPYRYASRRIDSGTVPSTSPAVASGAGGYDMGARRYGPDLAALLQQDQFSAAARSRLGLRIGAAIFRDFVRPSPLPAARIPPERRLSLPLQRRQVLLAGAKVVPYAAEGKEWHVLGCGHGATPRSWPDRRRQRYARMRWTVHWLCSIRAMKPEDTANLIAAFALGISVLSAGVAYVAIRSSRKTAKEQTALQARFTAIEEERRGEEIEARRHARVTLGILQPQIGKGDLVLTNEGPAGAWAVTFGVSSAVEGKQPPPVFGRDRLPVDLRPGQSMHFDMAVAMGDAELINAQVRWIDDAGAQEATYTLRTL